MPQELFTIRLELAGMRHQVIHAMQTHQADVQGQMQEAVDRAIRDFDFHGAVRGEVNRVLKETINRAISHAAASVVYSPVFQDTLAQEIANTLRIYREVREEQEKRDEERRRE